MVVVVVVGVADGRVGLFCGAVLAVVMPCFVVLWVFFFFFPYCGLLVVVVVIVGVVVGVADGSVVLGVADGIVVVIGARCFFWVVGYFILL